MFGQVSSQILRAVSKHPAGLASIGIRSAHHGAHAVAHSDPHSMTPNSFPKKHIADMDDLPVVGGSWQEYIDERNATWNKQLIASAVVFVGLSILIQQTIFFNAFPPELPEEMKNYHPWKDRKE